MRITMGDEAAAELKGRGAGGGVLSVGESPGDLTDRVRLIVVFEGEILAREPHVDEQLSPLVH